ncbi:MAG TPA: relaxase/mobilization nuclease domain-containing protein, partial [Chitinophagaceae bacterium]|nr:relaxase/mobilization nuclease domain-containing protein [Chitinophagaceae bacterium]
SLNDRAQKSNTLHISLNFHPSEKLNQKILTSIANEFMERIGFGKQPYLVYEHRDAGHPHIHIVTTNIDSMGKRIDTYNIGKLKSEVARNEIENKFGLIRATNAIQTRQHKIDMRKVEYGKVETKRAITNVLDEVMTRYNFNSLSSFNAILKTFNVLADRGKEDGRIHKFKGLLYNILDQDGKKVGVPIKASLIYSKPTLKRLENLFKINQLKRNGLCLHLRNRINSEITPNMKSLADFIVAFKRINIDTVLRQNEIGLIYGITFVDHLNKAVFNGSELGKQFSAAAIQNKFQTNKSITIEKSKPVAKANSNSFLIKKSKKMGADTSLLLVQAINSPLKDLLRTEQEDGRLLYPLLVKRRKRKRKPLL